MYQNIDCIDPQMEVYKINLPDINEYLNKFSELSSAILKLRFLFIISHDLCGVVFYEYKSSL